MTTSTYMHGKKLAAAFAVTASLLIAAPALAQGMMGWYANGSGDAQRIAAEEAAGKVIWERLQAKQIACADLKDDDYEVLGDYFMGLMMGTAHASMDASMDARLGTSGNAQMHIAMGKRLSGCDAAAPLPQGGAYPMMAGFGMMGWAGNNGGFGWPVGGWSWLHILACVITVALVWTALVLSIIALAKWIAKQKK